MRGFDRLRNHDAASLVVNVSPRGCACSSARFAASACSTSSGGVRSMPGTSLPAGARLRPPPSVHSVFVTASLAAHRAPSAMTRSRREDAVSHAAGVSTRSSNADARSSSACEVGEVDVIGSDARSVRPCNRVRNRTVDFRTVSRPRDAVPRDGEKDTPGAFHLPNEGHFPGLFAIPSLEETGCRSE